MRSQGDMRTFELSGRNTRHTCVPQKSCQTCTGSTGCRSSSLVRRSDKSREVPEIPQGLPIIGRMPIVSELACLEPQQPKASLPWHGGRGNPEEHVALPPVHCLGHLFPLKHSSTFLSCAHTGLIYCRYHIYSAYLLTAHLIGAHTAHSSSVSTPPNPKQTLRVETPQSAVFGAHNLALRVTSKGLISDT